MRKFFYALMIGGIAYVSLVILNLNGLLPEGRLQRIAEFPGTTVWGMDVGGMDFKLVLGAAGIVLVILLALYTFMAK